jgi:IclR family acetate operon transcriptional repressor
MAGSMTAAGEGDSVRAVQRAVSILQAFTSAHPRMTVAELQRATGISRPTLYRLLQTLAASGLVQGEGEPQRYGLGPAVMGLAHVWSSGVDVAQRARPILERLRDMTGETAALFVLQGDRRLCLVEVTSRQVLMISRGVGETEHISRGASGKAILAHLTGDAAIASVWRSLPPEVNRGRLMEELARARKEGVAISRGEVFRGAVAIAAPYFGPGGHVAGSIGLFGPEARLDELQARHCGALLRDGARELTAALGGALPPAA